jgi:photosystem II stability/assembly factor-like uncharacterized protein
MNVSSRGPAPGSSGTAHGLDLAARWALAGALLAEPPARPNVDTKAGEVDQATDARQEPSDRRPRGSSLNALSRPNSSGQAQARRQPPGAPAPRDRTRNELKSISFSPDGRQGWVVGAGGTIAVSENGGARWDQRLPRDSADPANYASVFCPRAGDMWAVGSGVIRLSTGGGDSTYKDLKFPDLTCVHGSDDVAYVACSYRPDARDREQPRFVWVTGTRAVYAVDAQHVWAVGNGGTARAAGASNAAPADWPTTPTGTSEDLLAVHFPDARNGWAVGAHGAIVHTGDGANWGPQTSGVADKLRGEKDALRGVWFTDARRGWAVGDGGIVIATTDGGTRWTRMTSEWHRSDPETVGGTIWELDDNHRLNTAAGPDAGRTVVDALDQPLLAFHFSSPTEGWAIEAGGRMRFTADGGQTWDAPPDYRWRPAPWYYAACALSILLLVPTLRRPEDVSSKPREGPSVADRLLSDQPLGPGDRDRLKFSEIALGIANFLRNSRTKPPMTLAVTGKWGSGKTSLMNLVRGELARFGVRPVWFNAWHHQKEEHLLAALLENIRAQAVPPWYDPRLDGLMYRLGCCGRDGPATGRWSCCSCSASVGPWGSLFSTRAGSKAR